MIQIDMSMPKNCLDCPACNEYLMCAIPINGRKWGENDVREFAQSRPEWCPLKEQDPVEPELEGGGYNWWHVCGECHGAIDASDNYCKHCGRRIKHEEKAK
jgi:hypothetical protein